MKKIIKNKLENFINFCLILILFFYPNPKNFESENKEYFKIINTNNKNEVFNNMKEKKVFLFFKDDTIRTNSNVFSSNLKY